MFCSSCGSELNSTARFCSRCGTAAPADTGETGLGDEAALDGNLETLAPTAAAPRRPVSHPTGGQRPKSRTPTNPHISGTDAVGGGRFAPGAIIADRYRVVALLGRGGMGEVYRAEDLKLTQLVAIKFLPEALTHDEAVLARFHSEVRIARQVSHPNVCRVFDIGEADGIPFLTMEYVDGEDLSSLIRRIGRLPQDKAAEISRQICAGLSAAHEKGVVHRDLKPANLMLDGAGKIRITDFGLAAIAATVQGGEVRAGTPAYMAPEQLAGKEVTTRSDIYSLGLVMYEVLTGKRAFDAATMADLMKLREAGTLTNPSTLVHDLDPLLERVILRCLEKEPSRRPATALQVAAALPGGDPLAAALAAGETPSPEMVAAAGETEGLRPQIGFACLVGVCLLLVALLFVAKRTKIVSYISFGPNQDVLVARAQDLIRSFGYTDPPGDSAQGFTLNQDFLNDLSEHSKSPNRWEVLRRDEPPTLRFWYRQDPQLLVSLTPVDNLVYGRILQDQPPLTRSGARLIELSPQGKLLLFRAMTPQVDDPVSTPPVAPDYTKLFEAAGLDPTQFKSAEPRWYPLAWGDSRSAWEGSWPGQPELPLRVEAAGYRGKPIFFRLISSWDKPARMTPPNRSAQNRIQQWFSFALIATILFFGMWTAGKNIRAGRGDMKGARRLALIVGMIGMVNWLLLTHHVLDSSEFVLFFLSLSVSLFFGMTAWLLYTALEPTVRKNWPDTLITWSRLLAGNFKDPVLARDILLGTLFGLLSSALEQVQPFIESALGKVSARPTGLTAAYALEGLRGGIASTLFQASSSFSSALLIFFIFFILCRVLKKDWLAAVAFSLIFTIPSLGAPNPLIDALFTAPFFLGYLYILSRFGLVTLTVLYFVDQLSQSLPMALPLGAWYTEGGVIAIVTIVAIAIYGFYVSKAGKPLFGVSELDA